MGSGARQQRKAFVQSGVGDVQKDFWRLFSEPSRVKPKHLNNQQWRGRQRQIARREAKKSRED